MPTQDKTAPANPEGTQVNTRRRQQPDDPAADGKLPHERDQSIDMTDGKADPAMKKAYDDLNKGLEDTDARGADGKPLGSRKPTR